MQGLLEALRLFVVFYFSSHACSHYLGYASKASLRLRLSVAHGYIVYGGLDLKSLLKSRYPSPPFYVIKPEN